MKWHFRIKPFKGGIMVKSLVILLCCALFVLAETVSLSGTVKKSGGTTGIAGVKISLGKIKNLSAISDASGAFTISGATSAIASGGKDLLSPRFLLQGNSIVFTSALGTSPVGVEIFSSDGKRKASIGVADIQAGKRSVILPEFGSGINILRVTISGESFTRTIINLGNDLFLKNEIPNAASDGSFLLAKKNTAATIDTLVAEKTGYITKRVEIKNYRQENNVITLDTSDGGNPGACTREALQAAVDSYIAAQKAGDPTKMTLAANVKYTQDMKDITADKSIVKTALPTIASQIDIFDVDSCRTYTQLIVTEKSHPYVIGTRLKLDNGKISEVNTMVTDQDDWSFNATSYLDSVKKESWDILPTEKQSDRQTLINACNAYFDKIFDWTKDTIPWGDGCYRIEGGNMVANPCKSGTEGNSVKTTCRTYVVDKDKGAIDIYCYFGFGPDSHLFRLVNKKIVYILTMTACGDTVKAGSGGMSYCWGISKDPGSGKGYCDWYSH
jgi:hypothetical protein